MQTDILIDSIQDLLEEVGAFLLKLRTRGSIKGEWHGTQLKSEADKIAEKIITRGLFALTPNLKVVSEEDLNSHTVDRFSRYWLVDPIDGTASFCAGFDGFVSQLALMEGAQPLLGMVFGPAMKLMFVAERGAGAFLNDCKLELEFKGNNVVLTDNSPLPGGIAKLLYDQIPCSDYLESGSIGLKICLVANGKANLFVKDVMVRDWDLAPGNLILEEAGGLLVDFRGRLIDFSRGMEQCDGIIAASNQGLADRVIKLFKKNKKYGY